MVRVQPLFLVSWVRTCVFSKVWVILMGLRYFTVHYRTFLFFKTNITWFHELSHKFEFEFDIVR